ncbi:alpha/beta hydrolase [Streptomyces sp. URMC 123]|uniref:alpha/beta hydrolase n=1 Tax=Streptomyces sp. URMC 123 TaxID=3423403 RepID=UPI003F1BDBD1
MSAISELGSSPLPPWIGGPRAVRVALALSVVLVLLATSGWTAVRHGSADGTGRAGALSAWRHATIDGRALPDPEAAPRALGRFFDSLTPAQRTRLAEDHPLIVGNLSGAPVTLRYRANRIALRRASAVERERMTDERLTPLGRHEAGRRMHRFDALASADRQILAFDPTGPGRAAEVLGDLDRARQVSVVVPGVDTNLLTFQRTARRYTAPVGMAQSLHEAQRKAAPGARTAVIAWADYTAPVGIGMDAALGHLAEDGAQRLRALVEALPARAERVSLFCHSYGSVVCGLAAPALPASVTDIAVAGSPGMRVERAADLGGRARIWATRDADDWIQDVPHLEIGELGHGADPVSPAFGARVLSSAGAIGHTGYFQPDTEALRNFARIGVGAVSDVSCAGGGESCRAGLHGADEV